jgi:2'-5' RNA ligase
MARLARRVPRRRGRPVPPENLHVTLAFIGPVDEETACCLREAAARVPVVPFDLVLDTVGGFRRARVVWLGVSRVPEALRRLVTGLNEALAVCGYEPDPRPYTPHVTLFRHAEPGGDEGRQLPRPIVWPIREFVLVESATTPRGAVYRVLQRFPAAVDGGAEQAPPGHA